MADPMDKQSLDMQPVKKTCVVNLGLYRTGTTTLAKATEMVDGFSVHREFPEVTPETHRKMLVDPRGAIESHVEQQGLEDLLDKLQTYDFVCDGWFALLPLASNHVIDLLVTKARESGIHLVFLATSRDMESHVRSELHHWIRHDLEKKALLSLSDRASLDSLLTRRIESHQQGLQRMQDAGYEVSMLPWTPTEPPQSAWPKVLAKVLPLIPEPKWQEALGEAGVQNSSPVLPLQAILVTVRVGGRCDECINGIRMLLADVEADAICNYMVVIALDDDEYDSMEARELKSFLAGQSRIFKICWIRNSPRTKADVFAICKIWHDMAVKAWQEGASWITLLGDDIRIYCPFHYRAIYRAFLDCNLKLGLPLGSMFGCPWFNDLTFPGFPTFPIVGRSHWDIFGGLLPDNRSSSFVNQDLDPYLQRLYLKFGAAPQLIDVTLENKQGGTDARAARYKRVPANGWRDWVTEDVEPIVRYLRQNSTSEMKPLTLLDVVIPTFRIDLNFLSDLCSLSVPETMRTTFIVIVDNPDLLVVRAKELVWRAKKLGYDFGERRVQYNDDVSCAAAVLEEFLVLTAKSRLTTSHGNNIRVRCNQTNLGASASRNRGIEESAAEFILFLDDDINPSSDLLSVYEASLRKQPSDVGGLVGLVRFPRQENLPLIHAAVIMSYLIFSFEIAENPMYFDPAWGVTANILFRRVPGMRFDTQYAKTGGGEDVDFALRWTSETGKKLRSEPEAIVHHPFWKGSVPEICRHFANWAVGDSALFNRFPEHVYQSYPNYVETSFLLGIPLMLTSPSQCLVFLSTMFVADLVVDILWNGGQEFRYRRECLHEDRHRCRFPFYYILAAHALANVYVIVLEIGRLYGHLKRGHIHNLTRRFDWHCGRLRHSERNFRRREACKFLGFLAVLAWSCC